jgi:phage gpG-like protein
MDSLSVTQRDSSQVIFEVSPDLTGTQTMHFKHVNAAMTGSTLLDIGRSYTDDIKLNLSDSSAVILSGKSLKAIHKIDIKQ